MGVSTSLKILYYSKDKELIKKIDLDARADEFIYCLLNDGGSTFNPEKLGDFNENEQEIMKIYYDKESMSVGEGYAIVTQNVQDPKKLKKIWTKIRSTLIKGFKHKMVGYHNKVSADITSLEKNIIEYNQTIDKQGFFSKSKKIELNSLTPLMTEYDFDRAIFDNIWSLDCISQVLVLLDIAAKDELLVEITAADY